MATYSVLQLEILNKLSYSTELTDQFGTLTITLDPNTKFTNIGIMIMNLLLAPRLLKSNTLDKNSEIAVLFIDTLLKEKIQECLSMIKDNQEKYMKLSSKCWMSWKIDMKLFTKPVLFYFKVAEQYQSVSGVPPSWEKYKMANKKCPAFSLWNSITRETEQIKVKVGLDILEDKTELPPSIPVSTPSTNSLPPAPPPTMPLAP